MHLRLCTFLILMITASNAYCQDFTTINYTVADGLPSSEVYEVFQDSKGFLWFATDNGVVRFDGFELEKFNIDKGLTDPVVFGFFEDRKGRIWFRTYSGRLCFFEGQTIHPYRYNEKLVSILPLGEVNFIYDSDREEIHFAIENLLGKIDSSGNVLFDEASEKGIQIRTSGTIPLARMQANIESKIDSIVIDQKKFFINDNDAQTVHRQTRMVVLDNNLYFTIKRKIYRYDGKSVVFMYEGPGNIISISMDADKNIWAGYLYAGAQRFEKSDFKKIWTPEFLQNKSVTKVIQDRENNLWITTLENGIYHIPNINIRNTKLTTAAKIRKVIALRKSFMVGDEAGFVYEYDSRERILKQKYSLNSPILAGHHDAANKIWISAVGGTYVFDSLLNLLKESDIISCSDFCEDANGVVWGYGNTSLKKFDRSGNVVSRHSFNNRYRQFLIDENNIYFAGRLGLSMRDRSFKLAKAPAYFSGIKVSDLISLNDSTMLVATLGSGFIILNKRTWETRQFNSQSKFIADNVYSIARNGDVFWIATEKGLATTTLSELLTPHPGFQYLTRKSGLIANKINHVIADDTKVLAFSDEGLSEIPLPVERFANGSPEFYIKSVQINQHDRDTRDLTALNHSDNNIAIRFGYLSFNNPNIFSRYRLAGQDEWNHIVTNDIQFNALAPGTYKLELEYSVDNVHWRGVKSIPTIVINPPWWQTWYFKIGMGILTGLLIYFYVRYQVNVYRKHQLKLIQLELEAIEQERKRIAKDLHDSVGTDFSAIKMIVSQVLKKHNEPKSEEIESQFQTTIADIKTIIYGLSPPGLERYGLMAALQNYIDKLKDSIPVEIHLNTFGSEVKNPKITLAIFRVIQELISNSLKHANASTIRLHVSSFDDLINIVYEDNGKGFSWAGQSQGLGLYNIESRLQTLNGRLHFDSGEFGVSYTIDIPLTVHST